MIPYHVMLYVCVPQIWDLRFASAPVRQCEGHQRGIQSIAWCEKDPDMFCTAAKDNRCVCSSHFTPLPEQRWQQSFILFSSYY